MSPRTTAYRGSIFHFVADPYAVTNPADSYRYFEDGLLVIADSHIVEAGPYGELQHKYAAIPLIDYTGSLIMPGFVDCHVHYPQMEIIASYGEALLDWLQHYTFPCEARFADPLHADTMAQAFIGELLRNGTTTALVMASSHPQAVASLCAAAEEKNLRLATGLMMMDRNAPASLLLPPTVARDAALRLIERWHGRGRLSYAISPRFALTSSPEGLRAAAELKEACPAALVHTHLAENQAEIAEVRRLFPEASSYLDVYHRSGLTGPTAVFAHSIYLSSEDYRCLAATRSSIVHCPTSNLFLGSGLFNFAEARLHGIKVGLGTDVGGGTSFSLLKTMAEAYKVSTFHRHKLSALQAFYAATLGGAECLGMARYIGNFSSGKEADFIVINPRVSTLQKLRIKENLPLSEQLFALMILGDDRNIVATYCAGIQRY